MAAAPRGPGALAAVIRTQRQHHLQQLRSLAQAKAGDETDVITRLLVDAAALHTEADLRVVDLAEEQAAMLLAAARADGAVDRQDRTDARQGRRSRG
jgi:hypothetical protein